MSKDHRPPKKVRKWVEAQLTELNDSFTESLPVGWRAMTYLCGHCDYWHAVFYIDGSNGIKLNVQSVEDESPSYGAYLGRTHEFRAALKVGIPAKTAKDAVIGLFLKLGEAAVRGALTSDKAAKLFSDKKKPVE